jgi:hypothetical protein
MACRSHLLLLLLPPLLLLLLLLPVCRAGPSVLPAGALPWPDKCGDGSPRQGDKCSTSCGDGYLPANITTTCDAGRWTAPVGSCFKRKHIIDSVYSSFVGFSPATILQLADTACSSNKPSSSNSATAKPSTLLLSNPQPHCCQTLVPCCSL